MEDAQLSLFNHVPPVAVTLEDPYLIRSTRAPNFPNRRLAGLLLLCGQTRLAPPSFSYSACQLDGDVHDSDTFKSDTLLMTAMVTVATAAMAVQNSNMDNYKETQTFSTKMGNPRSHGNGPSRQYNHVNGNGRNGSEEGGARSNDSRNTGNGQNDGGLPPAPPWIVSPPPPPPPPPPPHSSNNSDYESDDSNEKKKKWRKKKRPHDFDEQRNVATDVAKNIEMSEHFDSSLIVDGEGQPRKPRPQDHQSLVREYQRNVRQQKLKEMVPQVPSPEEQQQRERLNNIRLHQEEHRRSLNNLERQFSRMSAFEETLANGEGNNNVELTVEAPEETFYDNDVYQQNEPESQNINSIWNTDEGEGEETLSFGAAEARALAEEIRRELQADDQIAQTENVNFMTNRHERSMYSFTHNQRNYADSPRTASASGMTPSVPLWDSEAESRESREELLRQRLADLRRETENDRLRNQALALYRQFDVQRPGLARNEQMHLLHWFGYRAPTRSPNQQRHSLTQVVVNGNDEEVTIGETEILKSGPSVTLSEAEEEEQQNEGDSNRFNRKRQKRCKSEDDDEIMKNDQDDKDDDDKDEEGKGSNNPDKKKSSDFQGKDSDSNDTREYLSSQDYRSHKFEQAYPSGEISLLFGLKNEGGYFLGNDVLYRREERWEYVKYYYEKEEELEKCDRLGLDDKEEEEETESLKIDNDEQVGLSRACARRWKKSCEFRRSTSTGTERLDFGQQSAVCGAGQDCKDGNCGDISITTAKTTEEPDEFLCKLLSSSSSKNVSFEYFHGFRSVPHSDEPRFRAVQNLYYWHHKERHKVRRAARAYLKQALRYDKSGAKKMGKTRTKTTSLEDLSDCETVVSSPRLSFLSEWDVRILKAPLPKVPPFRNTFLHMKTRSMAAKKARRARMKYTYT